jgi:hypothetical protein
LDINSLIQTIIQSVQGAAILLILGGMFTAFLWKISAIINMIVGLLLTILLTYFAFSLTGNLGLTIILFLFGFGITVVIAALGAITAILEGFMISAFGFWAFFATGNLAIALTAGNIIIAIVASIVTTIVSVFVGGYVFSISATLKAASFSANGIGGGIKYITNKIRRKRQTNPNPGNYPSNRPNPQYLPPQQNPQNTYNPPIQNPPHNNPPYYTSYVCRVCGSQNRMGAKFCKYCGKQLP